MYKEYDFVVVTYYDVMNAYVNVTDGMCVSCAKDVFNKVV